MSDAAGFGSTTMTARLTREIDESECRRRNALSIKQPGLKLRRGATVTVLETLDSGNAFLVEFGSRAPDRCDWLGVVYPTEIEIVAAQRK